MNLLQRTDKYASRLLMIGFFLPQAWQATAIMSACGYFTLRSFFSGKPVSVPKLLCAVALGALFLLYAAAVPMSPAADHHLLLTFLGNRMTLLLVPLLFAIVIPVFGSTLMAELRFFVYTCLAACAAANIAFLYHLHASGQAIGPLGHVAYRQYMEHFLRLHPTYLSMYLVFAICLVLCDYVPAGKITKSGMLYLLLIFLLALLAKAPLIALFFIFLHYAYHHRYILRKYKMMFAVLAVAIIGGGFLIPFTRQRIGELFSFFDSHKTGVTGDNSMFERKMIWNTDTSLIRHYWLTGTGPGRMLRLLDYRYLFYSISHQFATGYFDPHNEYFWEWLSFGIVGFFVITGMLLIHIAKVIKTKNHLYLYLMCLLCVTFATESVLSRQQGILFYAVFTSMLFFYKAERNHKLI